MCLKGGFTVVVKCSLCPTGPPCVSTLKTAVLLIEHIIHTLIYIIYDLGTKYLMNFKTPSPFYTDLKANVIIKREFVD